MAAVENEPPNAVPVLVDFVSTVPQPLTTVLVQLAPHIAHVRSAAAVVSWQSPSIYNSWLLLALWWSLCLFSGFFLRYLVPVALLLAVAIISRQSTPPRPAPVTEQHIQNVINNLTTIHSLLPPYPSLHPPDSFKTPQTILRSTAILYIPYLCATHFIPLRILVAVLGTILLTYRASWASTIRTNLWRSAWFRWSVYHAWSRISGVSLPPPRLSLQPTSITPTPANSVRFLFTIFENQRWWMGLDWTAALLPGERPSWCSAAQHAVSPPTAFSLPGDTVAFLSDGKGGRIKRTAIWKWEEAEWRVLVKKDGGGINRVEKPLPREDTPSGSRLLKAAAKMKEVPISDDLPSEDHDSGDSYGEDPETDPDGWVYGDNKWEARSGKGGMGKYTRYRRWTRVAVVSELVEVVEPGELGVQRGRSSTLPMESSATDIPLHDLHDRKATAAEPDSPLRLRLKSALTKTSLGPNLPLS
ncbi:integral peroxisomal membrane peroxin-domain-containing protein [Infundibulicybe gibba]|nr:integral peroxisomal membrane peroxin-domain-containing protein [Infundibulicybe gibba]